MTEQQVLDPTPSAPDGAVTPATDEPAGDGAASSRAREWLAQLEAMIADVAREAAPVARVVGAKAAELAAVAAVKAGPLAHKAADATTEYGQRFADKAHSVAADWRHENEAAKTAEAAQADAGGGAPDDPDA